VNRRHALAYVAAAALAAARPRAFAAAAGAGAGAGADDPALAPEDWTAIRAAITAQVAALRDGDAAKAFSQASPGIRRQFGNAARFMTMVRDGYTPLLEARYTEFLAGAVIDGRVIQPLRLVARDEKVEVALYTMQKQREGGWKIAGCAIAPSTLRSA
jgi:hypothetical protein